MWPFPKPSSSFFQSWIIKTYVWVAFSTWKSLCFVESNIKAGQWLEGKPHCGMPTAFSEVFRSWVSVLRLGPPYEKSMLRMFRKRVQHLILTPSLVILPEPPWWLLLVPSPVLAQPLSFFPASPPLIFHSGWYPPLSGSALPLPLTLSPQAGAIPALDSEGQQILPQYKVNAFCFVFFFYWKITR